MVLGRRFDTQATALTKQGRLAVYPSSRGQDACQVGAALALRDQDWLFPTYRDSVAILTRGVPAEETLTLLRGDWHCGYDPYEYRVAPQCTPLATNTLHAVGLAYAARLKKQDQVALVLLGDGATSEGDTHEALNFAAVWKAPVVFLVQNNGYAISVPLAKQTAAPTLAAKGIGYGIPSLLIDGNDAAAVYAAVRAGVERAAAGGGPTLIEAITYRIEAHTNADDATRYRASAEVSAWLERDPIARLEAYLRAGALLDDAAAGRLAAEAERLAEDVRMSMNADVSVDPAELFEHVYARPTAALERQRAALLAELAELEEPAHDHRDVTGPDGRHRPPGPASQATPPAGPSQVTMAAALNRALADSLAADDRVVVFGEDVGTLGGVFRVTDGLAGRFGEQRVFDTPLAESGIVGTAIGMAMNGLVPVVEMQFDAFAYPAFEQVTSHLAKLRNRTRGKLALPVVIRIPFGGGIGGVEHHSDSSEAYYTHTPGLRVVTPGTPADAYRLLRQAIGCPDPVVFLEPKRRYWSKETAVLTPEGPPIDRAVVRRPGRDVTLIAYGGMVATALEAAEAAVEEDWDVEVIDLRSLSPFDDQTLTESVRRTGRAVIVHEAAGFARLRRRGRRPPDRAVLPLPGGADPARHRPGHPVPAAAPRAVPPAEHRPHPRRHRPPAVGGGQCLTSCSPTSARALTRPRSSPGASSPATASRSTR